tara:strand:+ start:119 stop:745 length:627 start_codon:yes stop_codon:yes gene_type:complete
MTIKNKIMEVVNTTYKQMYPEEAEDARSKGQRLRRAKDRALSENPGLFELSDVVKMESPESDIEKYGVPPGAELNDNEDGYDSDEQKQPEEQTDYWADSRNIVFNPPWQTIGGDNSVGGKTKFRLWLENVYLKDPNQKDLKQAVDGVSGKKKRNMMKRISYGVRMHIAKNGLKPNASSHYDTEDDTYATEITYNKSGRTWKANKGKRK